MFHLTDNEGLITICDSVIYNPTTRNLALKQSRLGSKTALKWDHWRMVSENYYHSSDSKKTSSSISTGWRVLKQSKNGMLESAISEVEQRGYGSAWWMRIRKCHWREGKEGIEMLGWMSPLSVPESHLGSWQKTVFRGKLWSKCQKGP